METMKNLSLEGLKSQSKSAIIGYVGAAVMLIGFASEWPKPGAEANLFKAINLAGATCAICLAGICRNTKKNP